MSSQVLLGIKIYQTLNANSVVLARKFNKSKSKFWHHVIALPRKISKIYLQVFFPFSFHQIEDLRCSNCVSYGTKHSSLQIEPWSPPHWILLIFYCWSVIRSQLCVTQKAKAKSQLSGQVIYQVSCSIVFSNNFFSNYQYQIKANLTVRSNPDKLSTENEAFRKRWHLVLKQSNSQRLPHYCECA